MVAAAVRQVFTRTDPAAAHTLWRQVADQLRGRFPRVAALMNEAKDDVLAYLAFPEDWPRYAVGMDAARTARDSGLL